MFNFFVFYYHKITREVKFCAAINLYGRKTTLNVVGKEFRNKKVVASLICTDNLDWREPDSKGIVEGLREGFEEQRARATRVKIQQEWKGSEQE